MLVLSRKPGETVLIGYEVEVEVLSVDGQKAKLGIHAPGYMSIVLDEVIKPPEGLDDYLSNSPPPIAKKDNND